MNRKIWSRRSLILKGRSLRFLFCVSILLLVYLLFPDLDFFQALLERLAFSLGERALSLCLSRVLGCSAGIACFFTIPFRTLLAIPPESTPETPLFLNSMLPYRGSGASTSDLGQRGDVNLDLTLGHRRDVNLDLTLGHRGDVNLDLTLGPPAAATEMSQEPNLGIHIPEWAPPLFSEEDRKGELSSWLSLHFHGKNSERDHRAFLKRVDLLFELETKIEAALVNAGYTPASILQNRHRIRTSIFYSDSRPLSAKTLTKHLEGDDISESLPFQRLLRACKNYEVQLDANPPVSE